MKPINKTNDPTDPFVLCNKVTIEAYAKGLLDDEETTQVERIIDETPELQAYLTEIEKKIMLSGALASKLTREMKDSLEGGLIHFDNKTQQDTIHLLRKRVRKSLKEAIKKYGNAAMKRDIEQAFEDLFHEVMVELFLCLKKGEKPTQDIKIWCFVVARNILITQGKTANKKRDTETPLEENILNTSDEPNEDQITLFRQALNKLSQRDQDLLYEKYLPDEKGKIPTFQEVSKKLGTTPGVLRQRVYHSKLKLAEIFRVLKRDT